MRTDLIAHVYPHRIQVDRYAQYINDTHVMSGKKLPDHVDWRLKGAVTMVKDQGVC
jgi:hypothetical protein